MKKIIKKFLFPNEIIGFIFFNLGFVLLIYVFSNNLEETILAYISYLLSFYGLIIFCIWFYNRCRFSHEFIKNSKIYQLYKRNLLKVTMYSSFIFNLIYGIFNLGIGIYYVSWWFITYAFYYLLLCFMKFYLVKHMNNKEKEYKMLRYTGMVLLFLNLILVGIIILIIKQDQIINYNGFIIYLVALYDFYLIISAIINVIKHRKNNKPIVVSSKCINLTVAMISMISLEVAMIYQFGNNNYNFKYIMTSLMGVATILVNSFMSVYMIIKANRFVSQ